MTPGTTSTRPPAASQSCGRPSRQRRRATRGYEVSAAQVLVTNGGKHAVYNAFAALLDPGDEVLLPAPYWTTYPEPIRLAGGVPVVLPTDETQRLPGHRRAARGGPHATAPRRSLFVSPSNPTGAVYPRSEVEAIGRWAVEHGIWVVTDEIYEHLTYDEHEFTLDARAGPRAARPLRRHQRRGQDLRHDRLAGRLDDRPARRGQGGHQPAVARRRRTSPTSASAPRWPRCRATSTAVAEMREAFERRGRTMHQLLAGIEGVTLLEPQGAFYAFPNLSACLGRADRAAASPSHARSRRALPRRGQGRDRPWRGVRRARLRPHVLRARRRRPGRGLPPHRRPAG